MKLYAGAIVCQKQWTNTIRAVSIVAESLEEAEAKAYMHAIKVYPSSDGYFPPNIVVTEIPKKHLKKVRA